MVETGPGSLRGESLGIRTLYGSTTRFSNPATRENELNIVAREVNALGQKDRRIYTRNLLRQIAIGNVLERQELLLDTLEKIDLSDIPKLDVLAKEYNQSIGMQSIDSHPNYLLDAGKIVFSKIATTPRHWGFIRKNWEIIRGRNAPFSQVWDDAADDIEGFLLFYGPQNDDDIRPQKSDQIVQFRSPSGYQEVQKDDVPAEVTVLREFLGDKLWSFFDSTVVQVRGKGTIAINDFVKQEAKTAIDGLNEEQTTNLVVRLVNGMGQDDNHVWTVNRRDGALEMLKLVNLEKVDKEKAQDTLFESMKGQPFDVDPLSSPYSLIEAAAILVPQLPATKETRDGFIHAANVMSKKVKKTEGWEKIALIATVVSNGNIISRWENKEAVVDIANIYRITPNRVYTIISNLRTAGVKIGNREHIFEKSAHMPELVDEERTLISSYRTALETVHKGEKSYREVMEAKKAARIVRVETVAALRARNFTIQQISEILNVSHTCIKNDISRKANSYKQRYPLGRLTR